MQITKRNIIIAVALSIILHIFLFTGAYFYLDNLEYAPPKEEIIQIDLNDKAFKIADIARPKEEKVPPKAKHLGLYDSSVEDETVAAETIRAPGRPATRGGEGIEDQKKKAEDLREDTDGLPEPRQPAKAKPEELAKAEPEQLDTGFTLRRIPEDFYPDYKRGSHTYINVLKHPDIGYFVRLKRVFKLAWDPTHVLMRRRINGEVSRGSIKCVLGLAISASGEIDELFVINGSGLGDYDDEALRAVRASAPFSAPPGKLLGPDKILRVSWTFVVYM